MNAEPGIMPPGHEKISTDDLGDAENVLPMWDGKQYVFLQVRSELNDFILMVPQGHLLRGTVCETTKIDNGCYQGYF